MRPRCSHCTAAGPTIDGYCPRHLPVRLLGVLETVSADDVLTFDEMGL